jgi:hypothetical protein
MFADSAGTAAKASNQPEAAEERLVGTTAMATTAPLRESALTRVPELPSTSAAPTAGATVQLGLATEDGRTVLSCRLGETLYDPLMHERNELVRKEAAGLEEGEGRRLAFVRWQLEEIELARMAPGLRALETVVKAQQRLATTVTGLVDALREGHPAAVGSRRGG